jgi:hypothetical protein
LNAMYRNSINSRAAFCVWIKAKLNSDSGCGCGCACCADGWPARAPLILLSSRWTDPCFSAGLPARLLQIFSGICRAKHAFSTF